MQMKAADHKNTDPRLVKTTKLMFKLHHDTNQSENCPRAVHIMLLEHQKPLQGGSHSLEGISPLWTPLPGKAIIMQSESESLSVVSDSATPWTLQAMEFSRPEYWSG